MSVKNLKRSEFGDLLKRLIRDHNTNQSALAEAINVGRDSISTYCSGKTLPGPRIRKKLADFFGVDVKELVPNKEPERKKSFSLDRLSDDDGRVHLFVNMIVSENTALWIQLLLREGMTPTKLAAMSEDIASMPNTTADRRRIRSA